jgi:hypothetical protein
MMRSIGFVACVVSALVSPALGAPSPLQPGASTGPAYVCVRVDDGVPQYRAIGTDGHCGAHETLMLLVASATTPFVADASTPSDLTPPTEGFLARFAATPAFVPGSGPLLVHAALLVDADRAAFALAPTSAVHTFVADRDDASNVSCAPTVDGHRIGEPTRLLAPGQTIERPSSVVFDSVRGSFAFSPPAAPPDVLWSRLDESLPIEAGRHQFAMLCLGRLGFRFRGIANLVILQRVPHP